MREASVEATTSLLVPTAVDLKIEVRPMEEGDIPAVIDLAAYHFGGYRLDRTDREKGPSPDAEMWVQANFRANPVKRTFVAAVDGVIQAYVVWAFHGGPRRDATLELEQIAASDESKQQKMRLGSRLVETWRLLDKELRANGRFIHLLKILTRDGTGAGGFYVEKLGARQVGIIPGMYSGHAQAIYIRNLSVEPLPEEHSEEFSNSD